MQILAFFPPILAGSAVKNFRHLATPFRLPAAQLQTAENCLSAEPVLQSIRQ